MAKTGPTPKRGSNAKVTKAKQPAADVLDLDALDGEAKPFPFIMGGEKFELCDLNDLDIRVVNAADSGDVEAIKNAIRYGLGDTPDEDMVDGQEVDEDAREAWEMFNANRLTIRKADRLFRAWLANSTLEQGE